MTWMLPLILAITQFTASPKNQHNLPKKCSFATPSSEFTDPTSKDKLLLFTSFSVPLESWKEHSHYLQKLNGAFVLRGLPNDSFEELQVKILELRKAGIQAEILLDPVAFEEHNIDSVPSLVLQQKNQSDKISGNLPIPYALTLFSEKGDTQELALKILQKAQNP